MGHDEIAAPIEGSKNKILEGELNIMTSSYNCGV